MSSVFLIWLPFVVGDTMELSYEASLHEATAQLKSEDPFTFEVALGWVSMTTSEITPQVRLIRETIPNERLIAQIKHILYIDSIIMIPVDYFIV